MERPFAIFPATIIAACTFDQHKLNLFSMNLKTISLDLLPTQSVKSHNSSTGSLSTPSTTKSPGLPTNNLPFGHHRLADLRGHPQVGHSSFEDSCFVRNHGEKETTLFGPIFSHWIGIDDDIGQGGSRHDRWCSLYAWHLLLFLSGFWAVIGIHQISHWIR